jgi:hypothetical protein
MTQNFSTRTVAKGLLCVTATVLMLLGALLLANSASAEPVNKQGSESPPVEKVAETVPPTDPVVEQVKEAPPAEKVAEVVPPVEPVEEQVKEAPPMEQVAEVVPPTEPVVEEVKEVPPVEKVAEVVPPIEPVVEKVKEAVPPLEPVKEAVKEVVPPVVEPVKELLTAVESNKEQLAASATSPSGPTTGPQAAAAPSTASTPATATPSVLVASLMTPPTGSEPGEPPTASTALSGASTHLTAAQRAVELSCQLSGLAGSATDNCTASWLSNQPLLATSPGALVIATPARVSAPAGDGSDGSGGSYGGGTRSFIPPPGPAPSGAVGGSAAGGAGVGPSGFFTLAGQLRLAGPRAMRRLRLSSKPWLTAFFVLIPERPG